MTTLLVELPPDVYQRLSNEAARAGKQPDLMVQEWVVERLLPPPTLAALLQGAGLLAALGPELKQRADPTIALGGVIAALDRASGPPLSEIVLAQRRSKAW